MILLKNKGFLALYAPTPQNSQTYSNNSLAFAGLILQYWTNTHTCTPMHKHAHDFRWKIATPLKLFEEL